MECLAHTMVPVDATLEEVIQMIGNIHYGNIITFIDFDLPKFGADHNEPLYIIVQLDERRLPRVLVDGGSGMNVLPAKMMDLLDIKLADLKPSVHIVKAYDSTSRTLLGVATLNIWFGKRMMCTEFQVLDIE